MRPKSSKPTSDELLAQFDDLGVDSASEQESSKTTPKPTTAQSEQDILAELDNLASQRPGSGPGTPRVSTNEPRPIIKSPKPAATTASPSAGRSSEEKQAPRKSGESARVSFTEKRAADIQKLEPEKPAVQEKAASGGGGGGGWWGGIFATATATASAAMKQAEAAVKEIQQNEEAQKWAQQIQGNVGALKDLGDFLHCNCLVSGC